MIDFSTYKFRCSGLKHLMTQPKTKADREAGNLSDSTKIYLRDIFIKEVYGRSRPDLTTGAVQKGTIVESDSMDLVKEVTGEVYFKNTKHFENDWIKGTPDIAPTNGDRIKDIKSNWDLWTFAAVDEKTARDSYYYQVLGYMWLTGKKYADLTFCLVNTPEQLMYREVNKLSYSMDVAEAEELVRRNHTFDDIPAKDRIKQFSFEFNEFDVSNLITKVEKAREYLQEMTL